MGLDWGELDILRNKDDGRAYIVDVNNTPAGPPNHLSKEDKERALQQLATTFARVFLGIDTGERLLAAFCSAS